MRDMVRITLSLLTIWQRVLGVEIGCIFVIDYCLGFFRQSSRGTSSDFAKNQFPRIHRHRTACCCRNHRAALGVGARGISQSKVDGAHDVVSFQSTADFACSVKLCNRQRRCVCKSLHIISRRDGCIHFDKRCMWKFSNRAQQRKFDQRFVSLLDCVISWSRSRRESTDEWWSGK